MLLKYVHTKFEGCLNSYEIGNLICVIILHLDLWVCLKKVGLGAGLYRKSVLYLKYSLEAFKKR